MIESEDRFSKFAGTSIFPPSPYNMKENNNFVAFIPIYCTECGEKLSVIEGKNGKLKLMCINKNCDGISIRKFQNGMLSFEISGIGPAIYKKLYLSGVKNIADLLTTTPEKLIDSGNFTSGRALEKLMESIKSVKSIKVSSIIESLQFDNVGKETSKEIEKYFCGLPYDFTGMDYSIRNQVEDKNSEMMTKIEDMISIITTLTNVEIVRPKVKSSDDNIKTRIIEMTGSPKEFGFDTKNDFIKSVESYGIVAGALNKDCSFLVTDDLNSKTSKMTKAEKLGVQVVTYGQLIEILKNN